MSEPFTPPALGAAGPALSPDGRMLAFNVPTDGAWDVYAANADGSDAHLVLPEADNNGWSSDGSLILVDWRPINGAAD